MFNWHIRGNVQPIVLGAVQRSAIPIFARDQVSLRRPEALDADISNTIGERSGVDGIYVASA